MSLSHDDEMLIWRAKQERARLMEMQQKIRRELQELSDSKLAEKF